MAQKRSSLVIYVYVLFILMLVGGVVSMGLHFKHKAAQAQADTTELSSQTEMPRPLTEAELVVQKRQAELEFLTTHSFHVRQINTYVEGNIDLIRGEYEVIVENTQPAKEVFRYSMKVSERTWPRLYDKVRNWHLAAGDTISFTKIDVEDADEQPIAASIDVAIQGPQPWQN